MEPYRRISEKDYFFQFFLTFLILSSDPGTGILVPELRTFLWYQRSSIEKKLAKKSCSTSFALKSAKKKLAALLFSRKNLVARLQEKR